MLSLGRLRTSVALRCILPRSLSTYTLLHPVQTTATDVESIAGITLPAYRKWIEETGFQTEPRLQGVDLNNVFQLKRSVFMLLMDNTAPSDVPVILHLMSAMNESFELKDRELEYILRKVYKSGTDDEIKTLRRILSCNRGNPNRYKMTSVDTVNQLLSYLAKQNCPNEMIHWYTMLQDTCNMKPSAAVCDEIITLLTKSDRVLWDALLYVLGDMQYHGIPLSPRSCIAVLKIVPEQPASRWRLARQLLLDLQSHSASNENLTLSPEVLASTLLAMYNARQSKAVLELYQRVQAQYSAKDFNAGHRVLPFSDSQVMASLGLAAIELNNLPFLFEILKNTISETSVSGVLLYNYAKIMKTSKRDIMRAKYAEVLVEDTLLLLTDSRFGRPSGAGYHTGLVILWLLNNDKTALAVYLWNRMVSSLVEELKQHPDASEQDMTSAISQVIGTLCHAISARSASTDSATYARNRKITKFLSAASFGDVSAEAQQELMARFVELNLESVLACEDGEELADKEGEQRVLGSLMSVDLHLSESIANAALSLFINMQEKGACFALWKRCLERAISVDERLSNDLLDQLVEDGDYDMVIELCDFLLAQNKEKFALERMRLIESIDLHKLFPASSSGAGDADSSVSLYDVRYNGRFRDFSQEQNMFVSSQQRGFSPYLFAVGMKAMAAKGDTESLFRVLSAEIPSRGFVPSNSVYSVAIKSLRDAGKFAEAVQLFQICCDQRAEFIALNKTLPKDVSARQQLELLKKDPTRAFHKKIAFTNHSLAADSPYNHSEMLLTTLECCAHARLGVEAMKIFAERESLFVKGLQTSEAGAQASTQLMLQHVLVALASPQYCSVIPDFLLSTSTLQHPITPNSLTFTLAVAAAVSVQDADTVGRLLNYGKGFSYNLEEQVQTKQNMMGVVQHTVLMASAQEEEAQWVKSVWEFLERCEHFLNLK